MPPSALKALLLALISPIGRVEPGAFRALSAQDWKFFWRMVRQHRLQALLHWRLKREHHAVWLPDAARARLAAQFGRNSLRALAFQRELLLVHRVLQAAGIAHIALKGAYLAFHSYPHPALRPLRDLDILVPPAQAMEAYRALSASGWSRRHGLGGDLGANLDLVHQLPPLQRPGGCLDVEVHAHTFHRDDAVGFKNDPSEDPEFWQRCMDRSLAGAQIRFASPTDLLLHMIVHAVYNHQFDNGPLLLSDLAGLLDSETIDWPLFWRLADRGAHRRGCVLALSLLERHYGPKAISWPDHNPGAYDGMPLEEAALMMLRDTGARQDVELQSQVRAVSPSGRLRLVWGRLFPPRQEIAARYPVSAAAWAVHLWYPINWWHLFTRRLPAHLRSYGQHELGLEVAQTRRLKQWLVER